MCHGVFDLIHPGHFAHFKAAKAKVDILFVSVTGDVHVNKGPGRPLFSELVRAETISMLECIDYVLVSNNETAVQSIEAIKPNIYFKGSDYVNPTDDVTGMIVKEIAKVKEYGGEIQFTNELTASSTNLINSYFSNHTEEVESWLNSFRAKYSTQHVNHYLDLVHETHVGIIGEVIIDKYTNCEPLAKSSKDPILAFHVLDTNTFMGGVLAIRHNISSWSKEVSLFTSLPKYVSEEDQLLLREIQELDNLKAITSEEKFITKHRYVDIGSESRIFETYDFSPNASLTSDEDFFEYIKSSNATIDMWIVADYGHGLISRNLAKQISNLDKFLAVNTQANAGNRGYNTITKYPKADFLSLNGAELQLELRDKNPNYDYIVPQYMKKLNSKYAVLTRGSKGMMVFSEVGASIVPALGRRVLDKVGAGDSVLAIGSILARNNAPIEIIGLISSIVAAHEISQLGHRTSLKISDIKKAVRGLLG
jgi:cytidyltransferase-like protein